MSEETKRNLRKVRIGTVISDSMDKTVTVLIEDRVKHAVYGKTLKLTKKLKAHDEQSLCAVGDRVRVMETRPLSKTKRWRVLDIVRKAE